MQTYVASFAYLRRLQIRWDQRSITRESRTARELRELLLSSRRILCELETAVNQTQSPRQRQKQRRSGVAAVNVATVTHDDNGPVSVASSQQQKQQQQQDDLEKLPQISRLEMNKRLKLRSKMSYDGSSGGGDPAAGALSEADAIDMRFVKHHYYDFLRTMWQLLRRDGKMERKRHQRRQQQQRQQHQQQQKRKQQKKLQQQQKKSTQEWQNKEFNEVSKPAQDTQDMQVIQGARAGAGAGAEAGGSVAPQKRGNGGGGGRRGKRQSRGTRVQRT